MRPIARFIGLIVFAVIQACVFALVLVATALAQFEEKPTIGAGCYTLFAYKERCRQLRASRTGTDAFVCAERRNYMVVSAVFAVLSILITLASTVFGVLMVLRIPCAVLFPLVLTYIASGTILVSWACMAVVYNRQMCATSKAFKVTVRYAAGFGSLVTASCLQLIDLVLLCVLVFA